MKAIEKAHIRVGARVRLAKKPPTPAATVLLIGDKIGTVRNIAGTTVTVCFDGEQRERIMWCDYLEIAD